jgi:hypothetical protein
MNAHAAFGNSTPADILEYTGAGDGARLMKLVLHDAQREYADGPAQGAPDTKVRTFTQRYTTRLRRRGGLDAVQHNQPARIPRGGQVES